MSVEMSTLDWRHGDVSLCHPLRDVELKEVALCVQYLTLDTCVLLAWAFASFFFVLFFCFGTVAPLRCRPGAGVKKEARG